MCIYSILFNCKIFDFNIPSPPYSYEVMYMLFMGSRINMVFKAKFGMGKTAGGKAFTKFVLLI